MADTFGQWNHQNSVEIRCVVHRFDAFNLTVYIAIRSAVNQITLNSIHVPPSDSPCIYQLITTEVLVLYKKIYCMNFCIKLTNGKIYQDRSLTARCFLSCCCLLFCFSVHLLCFASSRFDFSRNIFRFLFDWKPFFLSIFNREWAPVLFYSVDLMRVIALLRKKNRQPFSIEKCIRRQGENHLYSRNTCSCIAITFALRGAKIS